MPVISLTLDVSEVAQLDKFCELVSRTREEVIRGWVRALKQDDEPSNESRVLAVVKKMRPNPLRARQIAAWLDSVMSNATVYRALESLVQSGAIKKAAGNTPGERRYTVYWMEREVVSAKM